MSSTENNLNTKKLVVLGDSNVGKTSIICRYANGFFDSNCSATLGTSFVLKQLPKLNGNNAFKIWDTAGQERYRSVVPIYLRDTDAILLVFDLTNKNYLESIDVWVKFIHDNADSRVPVFVVGNKLDLAQDPRAPASAAAALSALGLQAVCTSAKTGQGIDQLFESVGRQLFGAESPPPEQEQALQAAEERERGCC